MPPSAWTTPFNASFSPLVQKVLTMLESPPALARPALALPADVSRPRPKATKADAVEVCN
jgi:hypothetical protein